MLSDPRGTFWGYSLSKTAGVPSGVMYPILHRWLGRGWLSDGWEEFPESRSWRASRPRRRYYRLTGDGLLELGAMLERREAPAAKSRFAHPGMA
jgi:PadR family transcriptional regulator PadR